ncbi:MAG TPA: hypothetical protein VGA88_05080 [Burkholderiales bacterium]
MTIRKTQTGPWLLIAALATTSIAACQGGASEAEFVTACLEEGKRGVNSVGMDREASCRCAAAEAKSALSGKGYRAMILEMQGKKREAKAITSEMDQSEQVALIGAALTIFGKCAKEK